MADPKNQNVPKIASIVKDNKLTKKTSDQRLQQILNSENIISSEYSEFDNELYETWYNSLKVVSQNSTIGAAILSQVAAIREYETKSVNSHSPYYLPVLIRVLHDANAVVQNPYVDLSRFADTTKMVKKFGNEIQHYQALGAILEVVAIGLLTTAALMIIYCAPISLPLAAGIATLVVLGLFAGTVGTVNLQGYQFFNPFGKGARYTMAEELHSEMEKRTKPT